MRLRAQAPPTLLTLSVSYESPPRSTHRSVGEGEGRGRRLVLLACDHCFASEFNYISNYIYKVDNKLHTAPSLEPCHLNVALLYSLRYMNLSRFATY